MKVLKTFLQATIDCYEAGGSLEELLALSEFYEKRVTNENITSLFEGIEEKDGKWYFDDGNTLLCSKVELFECEITVDMIASLAHVIPIIERTTEKFEIKIKEK